MSRAEFSHAKTVHRFGEAKKDRRPRATLDEEWDGPDKGPFLDLDSPDEWASNNDGYEGDLNPGSDCGVWVEPKPENE